MSRKKHNKSQTPPTPSTIPSVPAPLPTPEAFSRQITFDSLEDKIRGEEMLQNQEQKKLQEERDVKKKLDDSEVERRLAELKNKLGLKNQKKK